MAPVKFDDISKPAADLLTEDYQTDGFQLKQKRVTAWDGATVTATVDLFGKDAIKTPAKLSWKFPKPFGLGLFSIDKLEVDKAGKIKLEASEKGQVGKDIKVELKSDLKSLDSVAKVVTFTGLPDTQIKLEMKAMKPQDFALEVTRAQGPATLGIKCGASNIAAPDVGARLAQGPLFVSLLAKQKFSVFNAHLSYKVSDVLSVAGTYQHGGKAGGSFGAGLLFDAGNGAKIKAKVHENQSLSACVKYSLAKGFTLLGGGKYSMKDSSVSYGLQVSIE